MHHHIFEWVDMLLLGKEIKTNSSLWNWNPQSWYPNYNMQVKIFFTINKFWKAVCWINPTALQCGEMGVSKQTRESQFVETWDIPNRGGYDTQSGSWRPNQEFKVGGVGWGNLWSHWELLNRHVWSNLCLRKHLRKLDIVMHACL